MLSEPGQECDSPEVLARYISYYSQIFKNKKHMTPFNGLRIKSEYTRRKKKYERLFKVCKKYNVTIPDFIRYSVMIDGRKTVDALLNVESFVKYANHKLRQARYSDIVKFYTKSANNIADMCIEMGISNAAECLRRIISDNRLAYEYVSGRISKYFIATIGNFEEIYEKMDGQSKEELCIIRDVANELRRDVNDAFMVKDGNPIQPVSFTNKILKSKLQANKNNKQ